MIIDAHVHLPVGDGSNSLLRQKERLLYEMKENKVNRCIVISDSSMESAIGTLDECVELFVETDNVDVVGGISPFYNFSPQLIKLKQYLDEKLIVGIKLFTGHEAFYLTDERLKDVYELAIQYNVPVLFHSGWDNSQYSDVRLVVEVAKRYPELKLVVCHCFYPELENCMALMEFENVIFDLSSVADDVNVQENIARIIKKIINKAPERVLFGSDFSCCSQREHINFIRDLKLIGEVEDKIFWRNAKRIYQLRGESDNEVMDKI